MNATTLWRKKLMEFPLDKLNEDYNSITFQSNTADELSQLLETFHILNFYQGDSELEKIGSLMEWVHNIAPKNGDIVTPQERNTNSILKAAKNGQLFCWDYATVMVEMLLAIGIKAFCIACLSHDPHDSDKHVGVMAYLSDLNKWAFFDPTFNTYFEDKIPMDIYEIRAAYSRGEKPSFRHITIQKEWALVLLGVEYDSYDQWYSDYMLKNTFRFSFPKYSGYGCENMNVEQILINPVNYREK